MKIVLDYFRLLKEGDSSALFRYLETNKANKILKGEPLLYWAVFVNNVEFIKILIERGADPNENDSIGRSLLEIASFYGYLKSIKVLLQNDVRITRNSMDRAYNGWKGNIQVEVLKLFKEYGWINLYLDDLRNCPEGFIIARTVEEAISIMETNKVHMLSLDHDLGMDGEGNILLTGYDFVKYICEKGMRPGNKVYHHTDNVVGREDMYQTLLAAQRRGFIDKDIEIYHYSITQNKYSID